MCDQMLIPSDHKTANSAVPGRQRVPNQRFGGWLPLPTDAMTKKSLHLGLRRLQRIFNLLREVNDLHV
jgi:hypothetical protein